MAMTDGHNPPSEELDKFIDGVRASQRNIVFPDTVRNERPLLVFLWRGSPDPSLVQRIGAWLFGVIWIGFGASFLSMAAQVRGEGDWTSFGIMLLISMGLISVGIRVFRNGFPQHQNPNSN
jgi:hypothetical protein